MDNTMDSESRLLRLPLEIREQIWRLLLCRPGGLAVYEKRRVRQARFNAEQMSGMMDMDRLEEIWGNEEREGEEEDEEEEDEEGIGGDEGEENEVEEEIWEDEEDGEQEGEEDQTPNSGEGRVEAMIEEQKLIHNRG